MHYDYSDQNFNKQPQANTSTQTYAPVFFFLQLCKSIKHWKQVITSIQTGIPWLITTKFAQFVVVHVKILFGKPRGIRFPN